MLKLLALPILFALTTGPGDELRDLAEDLRRLHERGPDGSHGIPDERVHAIEQRLTHFLQLPTGLQASLRDGGGGRMHQTYSLERDTLRLRLQHDGLGLCEVQVALDGERIFLDGLCFLDPEGRSEATRGRLRGRSFYNLDRLPVLYGSLLEAVDAVSGRGPKLMAFSPWGSEHSFPGHMPARFGFDAGSPAAPRNLTVTASLAMAAATAGETPAPSSRHLTMDGHAAPPADRWPALDEALDVGLELLGQLTLPGLVAVQARGGAPWGPEFQLELRLTQPHGEVDLRAAAWKPLHGEPPRRWRAMEASGLLLERALDLEHLLALARSALDLAARRGESLGAFAATWDPGAGDHLALVLTVPAASVWQARSGHLHVLRRSPGAPPRVVEETPVRDFTLRGNLSRDLSARAESGRTLELGLHPASDVREYDPRNLVRYGELAAPLMGGSALSARGARAR